MLCVFLWIAGCGAKQKGEPQAGPESAKVRVEEPDNGSVPVPQPTIDKLNVQALPTVVNLDDRPGPDGVQAKLFFFRLDNPMTVGLEKGVVEFVLYNGRVSPAQLGDAEPLRTWSYTADQLNRFGSKTAFGPGYGLSLNWGESRPTGSTITLSARLLRPNSKPLYAPPLYLAVGPR